MAETWIAVTWLICLAGLAVVSGQNEVNTTQSPHMCEKTLRENVPEVVQETVSFRVRKTKKCGFLWLDTCSSYSLGVKTVTKMRFRVKEIKVAVCCNGTDSSGGCVTVKPTCEAGRYGPGCELHCDCEANNSLPEICDDVTGYCFCLDDFGGPGCRQELNTTLAVEGEHDADISDTAVPKTKEPRSEVASGGDVVTRIIVAVVVVGLVMAVVVVVFCCWRCRRRRKGISSGSNASDDFVVTLNPTQDSVQIVSAEDRAHLDPPQDSRPESNYYATPEEVRKRKKEQKVGDSEETQVKPYDYVEMRSVSGQRPTLSGASSKPEVGSPSSSFSTQSMARRIAERDSTAGRLSMPYANMSPSGSLIQEADTSHYYMGETDNAPVSPTYSLMRRQDSGESVFDDDGYCTSPNHMMEDGELQYATPRYIKEQTDVDTQKPANKTENIYDSLADEAPVPISVPPRLVKPSDTPEYANVSEACAPPHIYHHIPENQTKSTDGYDHINFTSSTA